MNTEKKETDNRSVEDLMNMINEFYSKEKAYAELPKDKLIDRLIMCEMELEGTKEAETVNFMELWYFVGDKSGVKYLSDEKPVSILVENDNGQEVIRFTNGEVNIRVPKKMEAMFPEIKYGSEPMKVKVSNITL